MSARLRLALDLLSSNPEAHIILSDNELAEFMVVTNGTLLSRGRLYDITVTKVSPDTHYVALKLSGPERGESYVDGFMAGKRQAYSEIKMLLDNAYQRELDKGELG